MNLPKLTLEQGAIWGQSLVSDSKTLEKINVRRMMAHLEKFVAEGVKEKFVAERVKETLVACLEHIPKTMVGDKRIVPKGYLDSWRQKKDGTLVVHYSLTGDEELPKFKYKPRRLTRVKAKRTMVGTIGMDVFLQPANPVDNVVLNPSLVGNTL